MTKCIKEDLKYSYKKGSDRSYLSNTPRLGYWRTIYSEKLVQALNGGARVISIDECSFNRQLWNKYSWLPINTSSSIINLNWLQRCSLILAVDTEGEYLGIICDGTIDSAIYCEFLKLLAYCLHQQRIKIDRNLVLTWDNAAIHHSEMTLKVLRKLQFYVHFLPAYSPELQCVELVFHLIKKYIRQNYTDKVLNFSQSSGHNSIIEALDSYPSKKLATLWKSVLKSCIKFIKGSNN